MPGSEKPTLDNEVNILSRFRNHITLLSGDTSDSKKSGRHKARESQIELALERVRARTMAMQKKEVGINGNSQSYYFDQLNHSWVKILNEQSLK